MINKYTKQELTDTLNALLEYKNKDLIRRPGWGNVNFEDVENDIEYVLFMASELSEFPIEYFTNTAAKNISDKIGNIIQILINIDGFPFEGGSGDPKSDKDTICSALVHHIEEFQTHVHCNISYLLYKHRGMKEIEEVRKIYRDAGESIASKEKELKKIIDVARQAAPAGAAVTFTEDFIEESKKLSSRSKKWLFATAGFAVATIISAVSYWPEISPAVNELNTLRNIVSKATVIAVFFTGTIWCGRIYRALIHQVSVNRHRALSLKTFQAFVRATDDPYVRDAVLMAATKTVFANVPTGLVSQSGQTQDTGVNFVEFGKMAKGQVSEPMSQDQ